MFIAPENGEKRKEKGEKRKEKREGNGRPSLP
jgi:hypothetical protein